LNKKTADIIEKGKADASALEEKYNNQVLAFLQSNQLRGLQYADKERPIEVVMKLSQLMIDEELKKQGAKVINRDGSLKLVQANDETMDFLNESHKSVTYDDFVKKTLADYKILSVSDPAKGNSNTLPPQYPAYTPAMPVLQPVNTMAFQNEVAKSLADLKN